MFAVNQVNQVNTKQGIQKQTLYASKADAIKYIMNDILHTHITHLHSDSDNDDCYNYYVYEKEGRLWFHAYDLDDKLDTGFNSLSELENYIASCGILQLPKVNESYQVVDLLGMQKHYYVNCTDNINCESHQTRFTSIDEAIEYIMFTVIRVNGSLTIPGICFLIPEKLRTLQKI